jgi:ribosomal protein S6--L-glutamate ligase
MRRQARDGEWRSNIHRGGAGTRIELDPSYVATAISAARAIGLDVAGVDLLEDREGPRVIEVNASPGFEGLERVCDVDVAGAILDRAESIAGFNPDARTSVYLAAPPSQETEFH